MVVADGVEWLVESFAPQYGHVSLRSGDGTTMRTTVRALLSGHVSLAPAGPPAPVAGSAARQPVTLADLTVDQRQLALLRLAHVLEVETGFHPDLAPLSVKPWMKISSLVGPTRRSKRWSGWWCGWRDASVWRSGSAVVS